MNKVCCWYYQLINVDTNADTINVHHNALHDGQVTAALLLSFVCFHKLKQVSCKLLAHCTLHHTSLLPRNSSLLTGSRHTPHRSSSVGSWCGRCSVGGVVATAVLVVRVERPLKRACDGSIDSAISAD